MHNQVILIGRLGDAPEIRNTRNGRVANFFLATDKPRYEDGKIVRNKVTGYVEKDTEWHKIVAFNGLAKSAEKCVKGMLVVVIGRNKTNKWQDRDGNDRYTTEVIANSIDFVAWPKRRDDAEAPADMDDDIPF